jgi:hypothetical protein
MLVEEQIERETQTEKSPPPSEGFAVKFLGNPAFPRLTPIPDRIEAIDMVIVEKSTAIANTPCSLATYAPSGLLSALSAAGLYFGGASLGPSARPS